MRLARLLGRRIARERFEVARTANDNTPAGRPLLFTRIFGTEH